ncbi:hypothetical protein NQ314_008362 [Rhamnusium bicolor]|uniref:GIY-YIG homing endonuclease n=1 Tax=Rhamnusium bicolor TaxID=1586634 RepID=A0AAV8YB13_9CUCU|nr:hypothetical protein NQ314_008362 [Rhamnusium bicolor]
MYMGTIVSYGKKIDRKTKWTEHRRNLTVRPKQQNIIRTKLPYPKIIARAAKYVLECWNRFTDEVMLNSVVVYTNQTIAVKSAEYVDKYMIKETHLDEIKAVFDLL